ncbi:MAG: hypothetical protein WD431_02500 [Cyclobacteriaceae bacterium]
MEQATLFSGNGLTRFQVNRRNNDESQLLSISELKDPNDIEAQIIQEVFRLEKPLAIQ